MLYPTIPTLKSLQEQTGGSVSRTITSVFTSCFYSRLDTLVGHECNGIKFDTNNNVLSRPMHRLQDLTATIAKDLTWDDISEYTIYFEGSYLHTAMIDGALELLSSSRSYDDSKDATDALYEEEGLWDLCLKIEELGFTATLVWVDPANMKTIQYTPNRHGLTLVAARDRVTGEYLTQEVLESLCMVYQVTINSAIHNYKTLPFYQWLEDILKLSKLPVAGWLFNLTSGEKYLVKSATLLKGEKVETMSEKRMLKMILEDTVDDYLKTVEAGEFKSKMEDYSKAVVESVKALGTQVSKVYIINRDKDPTSVKAALNKEVHPIILNSLMDVMNGSDTLSAVLKYSRKYVSKRNKRDSLIKLLGVSW